MAFLDGRCLAEGSRESILRALKARFERDPGEPVLVFEAETGKQIDFDLRGDLDDVLARAVRAANALAPRSGPGRPRLGVVSREVSLLPRHWEWLEAQPNGISAALRRLVDEARKRDPEGERRRLATDRAARFMTAVAGDRENFEEAMRALYNHNADALAELTKPWPADVRAHLSRLLEPPAL